MASQNDREVKIAILLLAAALLIPGAVAVAAASDRTDRMPVAVFDLRPAEARAAAPGNCCSWIRGGELCRLCRKGICQSVNTQSSPFERAGSRRKPSHSNDRSVAGSAMRFFRICRVISPRHIFV